LNEAQRDRVEPYAVAADVYTVPPHVGRGGWTWYTGAAAWLYRAGLESILGLKVEGSTLRVEPCIPATWPSFEVRFKYRSTLYEIMVENPRRVSSGVVEVKLDGKPVSRTLQLEDDGLVHRVSVAMG
jgi:cyclic beta-1,2-glucan synthetase